MPTGYTADVADGKITDFTEYALQCARAFGACIMLRDEPMSGEIPEFKPSNHNLESMERAEKDLSAFLAMNARQRRELHAKQQAERIASAERGLADNRQARERYEAMLRKAKEFQPPSPDHKKYAEFLVSQLEESIQFDCRDSYYEELKQPIDFDIWQTKRIKELHRDIEYHRNAYKEEVERTESRNRWVRQLKEALGVSVPQAV